MMRNKLKIIALTILVLSTVKWTDLLPQNGLSLRAKLKQLRIEGNKKVSRSQFQSWLRFKKEDIVSEQEVRQRCSEVLHQYAARGYYFAKLEEILFNYNDDSSQVNVTLKINEGDLLRVNAINFLGLAEADKEVLQDLETRTGKVFHEQTLEDDIDYLIRFYEEKGHPYCRVKIAEMKINNRKSEGESSIDIGLSVDPGPEVTVGHIEIQGNEQTKDFVILREMGFEKGEIYNQRKIDKVKPKLMKLGYFRWVNPPRLEMQKDGSGKLIIELQEGGHNRLDGVVGYNPSTPTSKGFVTGLLDISFGNLIGTGRQIEAHWERRTQKTQELRFRYLEPWVAGLPLHAGLNFEQLIQDTSYVQRSLGLDLRVQFNENLSLFSKISKRDITPDSLGMVLFGIPPSNSINLGIGFTYDTLDDLINPRKGLKYQTSFELGKKNIKSGNTEEDINDDSESFEQKRISIDFETYFSIFRWQVFALGFHGRQITSDENVIPITDQYRFGGTRTLRGYREEQFRGSRVVWANIEYRYLLGRRSRLFVFLDTGYFFREEVQGGFLEKKNIQDAKIGYGLGLRIDTKLGFFGIDYGLGEGDSLSNGKVHVSLINEF
ncbi:MAG: outer membrane protein assembly factor [bacterium]